MCQQHHQETGLNSEFGEGSRHLQAIAVTAPGHAGSSNFEGHLLYDDKSKRGLHLKLSSCP